MNSSRYVTLVIVFAVLIFLFGLFIGRIVGMIEIPPFGSSTAYLLAFGYSILHSLAFLTYKGKRWLLFSQAIISSLLYIMLVNPAIRAVEMATITNLFICDVVFNTFYRTFEQKNKLLILVFIFQIYYWATHAIWLLAYNSIFFFSFEGLMNVWFIPIMSILIPIMVIEGLMGGYTGYKIFQRLKNILNY